MCEVYRIFGQEFEGLDFSDQAMLDMFNSESNGSVTPTPNNGFAQGKKWLSVQVAMWKEDMIVTVEDMLDSKKTLCIGELYADGKYPHWWLDSVFKQEKK